MELGLAGKLHDQRPGLGGKQRFSGKAFFKFEAQLFAEAHFQHTGGCAALPHHTGGKNIPCLHVAQNRTVICF